MDIKRWNYVVPIVLLIIYIGIVIASDYGLLLKSLGYSIRGMCVGFFGGYFFRRKLDLTQKK